MVPATAGTPLLSLTRNRASRPASRANRFAHKVAQFGSLFVLALSTGLLAAEKQFTLATALKAAEGGDVDAQYFLGKLYSKGKEVPQDFPKAVGFFRKAAEQGHAFAQNDLGACFAKGWGVTQDYQEAARWYRKAAEQGDPLAQYSMGRIHLLGRGVPKDAATALTWFKKAAEQSQHDALQTLADIYLNGREGVKIDYREAFKWGRLAVDHGCVSTLNSLGWMYEQGYAVTANPEQAVACYQQAASKGDARGQMNLGRMFQEGRGVPKDLAQAYVWFSVALRNGEGTARHYLEELEEDESLTPAEIRQARARADEYLDRAQTNQGPSELRAPNAEKK